MQTPSTPSLNVSTRDFDIIFERHMPSTPTYKAAYEAAEQEHEQLTGHRRYRDSESYRVSRSRRLKRRK